MMRLWSFLQFNHQTERKSQQRFVEDEVVLQSVTPKYNKKLTI